MKPKQKTEAETKPKTSNNKSRTSKKLLVKKLLTKPATTELDKDTIGKLINGKMEGIEKGLKAILPTKSAHERHLIAVAVALVSSGCVWRQVQQESGLSWADVHHLTFNNKVFNDFWELAIAQGRSIQAKMREDTAHDHAVNGTDKRIYWQGQLVDTVKEYDHKLLQFLMEADNPAKYRSAGINIQNNAERQQVVWAFDGVEINSQKPPKTIEVKDENRDNAPPKTASNDISTGCINSQNDNPKTAKAEDNVKP